ncbi:MAG: hypothetical protein ABEH66_06675 [Halobacteriales archaeon]
MEATEPRRTDERAEVNCVSCNQQGGRIYRLRLHRRDGTHTDIEPTLCDTCVKSHLESEWIEPLVAPEG